MRSIFTKQIWKWSIVLVLMVLTLSACGGNSKDNNNASPSAVTPPAKSVPEKSVPEKSVPVQSVPESPDTSPANLESVKESESPVKQESSEAMPGFKLFEESTYGMSIEYPEEWTVYLDAPGAVASFIAPREDENDDFSENINIIVQDLGGVDYTLDEYAELSEQQIKQLITGVQITLSEKNVLDDGLEIYELAYSGKQGEFELIWHQLFFIYNGSAYILSYTAEPDSFDKYYDTIGDMVTTWSIE